MALAEADVWAKGGDGAIELAHAVLENLSDESRQLYDSNEGVENAIETIAREIYHAKRVEYSPEALKNLEEIRCNGWDTLPVCISKTQYSFSDDASQLGAPEGHILHVRELRPRTGAGFIVALTGSVMTMPGLGKKPAALSIDVVDGKITDLF